MAGRRRDHLAQAPYPRTARVNEVLREILADALERVADTDDRVSLLTVTAVEVSSDLSHATVYMSSLDEGAAVSLEELRPELQRVIGRQVRMKRTPQLHFVADPAVEHGSRVEEILRRLHRDQPDPEKEHGKEHGEGPRGPLR